MEKIKKNLPIVTPIFIALIIIHSLFVDYSVQFPDYISSETTEQAAESMKPKVISENGVLDRISYLESFLVELESKELPVDTEQEETKDNIKRVLVGQKLLFGLYLFYLLLTFSTAVSYAFRVWFHKSLANVLYPATFLVLAPKVFFQLNLMSQQEILSYFYFVFLVFTYVVSIISYRLILKNKELAEGFQSLQFSSSLEEEGRSPSNTKTGSIFAPVFHVAIIILIGILIGNLIYIPLFLLQKHYVTEFSYFIFFLLGMLSLFYIFNYKKVGGEPNNSNWKDLAVSFAYLQFRFLRNSFFAAFSTVVIVLFVTFLFSLLLFNIDLIQNHLGLFGKATEF
ncbi:LIC_10230 family protein [Leptospira bandrabouensis]|uniref:Uncharacterized protein n=1 Tax=Leptospira bandrabouensis TaxID=2484903 RepID=A0A6H3NZ13_9LEPT|nr:hypothetical protein [Leptospira bandrabouensis]MCG6145900.1 hypothetical protein [Leptospira bandrabouensis]MCG6153463.1 hypothetical protein [Leptospira bandrabouensis]MCG6165487.1 hypothetical protein [Leptospira bandrabouensis]MCW7460044.1 hypothetical protein [Leptospira bandrabouensis]MCW7478918.1 hypothetical protein [Leptospira bandrabouensis]